tara:strand:- start:6884 stop:7351 length:468 start_codon:yes stop_codon:yes gene_type:complete
MRINIISIESSRPEWTQEAFNSYKTKFNKSIDVIWVGCKPAQRSKNYNISAIVEKESALLLSKTKKEDLIVALDKEGSEVSTEKLRLSFDNWVSSSRDISFLIGGPDGLSRDLVRESDFCWSLSDLTFPHSIVPVLVIEQIFRVWSITQNHPYHK